MDTRPAICWRLGVRKHGEDALRIRAGAGVEDRRGTATAGGRVRDLPQTLRRFRQHSQPLFQAALEQTVRMAVTRGLLREDELAVDSMRLRAHASRKAVRTKSRSQQRVAELRDEVVRETDDARCALLEQKLAQHQQACATARSRGEPAWSHEHAGRSYQVSKWWQCAWASTDRDWQRTTSTFGHRRTRGCGTE